MSSPLIYARSKIFQAEEHQPSSFGAFVIQVVMLQQLQRDFLQGRPPVLAGPLPLILYSEQLPDSRVVPSEPIDPMSTHLC